jgi:hypothetical protein
MSHDDFYTTQILLLFDIVMFWKLVDMHIFTPRNPNFIANCSTQASHLCLRLNLTCVNIFRNRDEIVLITDFLLIYFLSANSGDNFCLGLKDMI